MQNVEIWHKIFIRIQYLQRFDGGTLNVPPHLKIFLIYCCILRFKNGDIQCHTCFVEISTLLKMRNSKPLDFSFQKVHSHVTNSKNKFFRSE